MARPNGEASTRVAPRRRAAAEPAPDATTTSRRGCRCHPTRTPTTRSPSINGSAAARSRRSAPESTAACMTMASNSARGATAPTGGNGSVGPPHLTDRPARLHPQTVDAVEVGDVEAEAVELGDRLGGSGPSPQRLVPTPRRLLEQHDVGAGRTPRQAAAAAPAGPAPMTATSQRSMGRFSPGRRRFPASGPVPRTPQMPIRTGRAASWARACRARRASTAGSCGGRPGRSVRSTS